jgi:hypothetical protein
VSILPMFGPSPGDSVRDLTFKIQLVNDFGREGVGLAAERDEAIGLLRCARREQAIREHRWHGLKSINCDICCQPIPGFVRTD